MNHEHEKNPLDAEQIRESLWRKLPELSRQVIEQRLDMDDPDNQEFFDDPDGVEQHEPRWHQWGIITHTEKVNEFYDREAPVYLKQWGVAEEVNEHFSEQIDGMTKEDLFRISIPLHDIGKFATRTVHREDGGRKLTFVNHEAVSGKIIRTPEFSAMMKREYGLTDEQLEYIARAAELHFELGKLRDTAKQSTTGYTMAFAESELFKEKVKKIMEKVSGFEKEVGLYFLVDSLGKTDIRFEAENDADIAAARQNIEREIDERNLNPNLINAALQIPINTAVAGSYLKLATNNKS